MRYRIESPWMVNLWIVPGQQASHFHEVALKPYLKSSFAVDRNRDPDRNSSLCVDVVAAIDALQRPALRLQQAAELLAGKRLHNASSIT
jgi:hypothetical protein